MDDTVLVIDCGSTKIAASAVDENGRILASSSRPNGPAAQPGGRPGWLIWDVDRLWETVCADCRDVVGRADAGRIAAVTVATMGADGAPVTASGRMTYPVICWQCKRAEPVMRRLTAEIGARRLFDITGYQAIGFNTLFRIAWIRENAPEALGAADKWLMMPGLLSQRLSGEMSLDVTQASTMMMLELASRTWSPELLDLVGLDESFFPPLIQPGTVIGRVTARAARETGLRAGTPVVAAGHDTQFAPVGSGAGPDEALLSTGTWEIAMFRTPEPASGDEAFEDGLITEADAVEGLYDPQLLMLASGALEWVRRSFFNAGEGKLADYSAMIAEAEAVPPGSEGVTVAPSFEPDTGPTRKYGTAGTVLGVGVGTTRGHVYRAALEGLCYQLRDALDVLGRATGRRPERLRVVGGGARNALWNQIRADVCGMPVVVSERTEATTVGAAVAAWVGAGRIGSLQEGERSLPTDAHVVEPGANTALYGQLYERYRMIAPSLAGFYRARNV